MGVGERRAQQTGERTHAGASTYRLSAVALLCFLRLTFSSFILLKLLIVLVNKRPVLSDASPPAAAVPCPFAPGSPPPALLFPSHVFPFLEFWGSEKI